MDVRSYLRQLFTSYCIAIGVIALLAGLVLRLASLYSTSPLWGFLGELGTFLAAVVAIAFVYNVFVRRRGREIFLADLAELLDERLPQLGSRPIFHESGRRQLEKKLAFYGEAKGLVVELGIALSSFVSYFEQRPSEEFRESIRQLLAKGVTFKAVMLDPESGFARAYAEDTNSPSYVARMQGSRAKLLELSRSYGQQGLAGEFQVYVYSHLPHLHGVFVDPDDGDGYMFVAHYLHGVPRADSPGVEFSRKSNPQMFDSYRRSLSALLEAAIRLDKPEG